MYVFEHYILMLRWTKAPACHLPTHLSDILVSVSKAEQEVWQHMDHIRLKQLPQHVTQHLKGKQ